MLALETLERTNLCTIQRIEEIENSSDSKIEKGRKFSEAVEKIEAMIVHMYSVTGAWAISEENPANAAEWWNKYIKLCDRALVALHNARSTFPDCDATDIYNLTLDHQTAARARYDSNIADSEWLKKLDQNPQLKNLVGQL
jgi:hypothetical protein